MTFDFLAMKTTSQAERRAQKEAEKEAERQKAESIEQVSDVCVSKQHEGSGRRRNINKNLSHMKIFHILSQ